MRKKAGFREMIAGVVFSVFCIFMVINFFFFSTFMKEQVRKKFIDENRYISYVTEEILEEEKQKILDSAGIIANYERAYLGLVEKIFYSIEYSKNSKGEHEGKVVFQNPDKLAYMKLANYIKNGLFCNDNTKNIMLIDKDRKLLGYTIGNNKDFLDTGNEKYVEDVLKNSSADFAGVAFLQEKNGKMFLKGAKAAASMGDDIRGVVVVGRTLETDFLENLKDKTNKDIILIINNKIVNSTIFENGTKITGNIIKNKLIERRKKIEMMSEEAQRQFKNGGVKPKMLLPKNDAYFEMLIGGREMGFNYFPIYDYENKLIGYIGVGFNIGIINEITHNAIKGFLIYSALFAIMLSLMLHKGLKKAFEPFESILVHFSKIIKGKYEKLTIKTIGELKTIVDSVNMLTETIELREEQLKDANRELEELNRELEEKVEERTYELKETITALQLTKSELIESMEKMKQMQEQLVATEKMASIGKIAGGIAHEVNSPLGAILTSAQSIKFDADFVKQKEEKESIIEGAGIIESAVRKVRDIISKLLIFTNKGGDRKEIVNLSGLFVAMTEDIRRDSLNEGIDIIQEFEPNIQIEGSGLELTQALKGIIINAKDAVLKKQGKEKFIKIKLSSETVDEKRKITIIIEDNGIGIKESDKGKLFVPFFTTKDVGKGLGLNLSVGREIFRKHNGSIEFESTEGIGTKFIITMDA